MEEWKTIPDWEGYYEASSSGRIRSISRRLSRTHPRNSLIVFVQSYGGKILSPKVGDGNYLYVNLWKFNKGKMCAVHRLVASAFLGSSSLVVNHKDGNRQNNCASNLEWLTQKENCLDAARRNGFETFSEFISSRRRALQVL